MKTRGFFSRCAPGLVVASLWVCSSTFGQAQNQPVAATAQSKTAYDLEITDGHLLLPGQSGRVVEATLGNVVDNLRARYTNANVVLSPGLANLKVADLKLRASQLPDELEALRVASGDPFMVRTPRPPTGPKTIDPNTGLPIPEEYSPNAGLFVLQAVPNRASDRTVEAFNIAPYLASVRAKPGEKGDEASQLITAVTDLERVIDETIMDLARGDSSPAEDKLEFRFHRGASLLVVIGPQQNVEVARTIVHALPGMAISEARFYSGGSGGSGMGSGFMPGGVPQPAAQREAEDAFRRRYGLPPQGSPTPPPGAPPAAGTPPSK